MASPTQRPQRPPRPKIGKALAQSASSLTNLGVLGAAAVAAAALVAWPILAIGGAAYGAMVAWDVANPDFWKKTFGPGGPATAKLPDPEKVKDPALRQAVEAILAARGEIAKTLTETPQEIQASLAGALLQIAELERHAATVVTRGEDLAAYLAKFDKAKLAAEIDQLDRKLRATPDKEAREQWAEARRVRGEQQQTLAELADTRERIAAKLAVIVATLEGLPSSIVKLRALDAQAMDQLSGDVKEELARMNGEIQVFEATLRSLAEVPGP
jgi:hypothetical protein